MKEETFRQKQAFEIYYSMGDKRSLEKLKQELDKMSPDVSKKSLSLKTLKRWSKNLNWQLRVEQRDIENAKKLEEKTNESIVDEKAEIRKIIKVNMNIIKQIINDYIQQGTVAELRTVGELNQLSNVLDKLARLEMDLVGENMLSGNVEIKLEKVYKNENNG